MNYYETEEFYQHIEYLKNDNVAKLKLLLANGELDQHMQHTVERSLQLQKSMKEKGASIAAAQFESTGNIIAPTVLPLDQEHLTPEEENKLESYLEQFDPFV